MAEFTYPGQYITEKSSGIRLPQSVSTSIGCVIGIFPKGEVGSPQLVTSYEEFKSLFYAPQDLNSLRQVRGFFDEGGGSLYVIRVENDTLAAATVALRTDGGYTLSASAKSKGAWANSVSVKVTGQAVASSASMEAVLIAGLHVNVLTSDGWEVGQRLFKNVSGIRTYLGKLSVITRTSTGVKLTFAAPSAAAIALGDIIEAAGAFVEVIDSLGNVVESYEKVTFEEGTKGYYKVKINAVSQYIQLSEAGTLPSTTVTNYSYLHAQGTATSKTLISGSDGTYNKQSFLDAVANVLPQITTLANVFSCLEDSSLVDADHQDIYNAITVQCELSKRYMNLIQVSLAAENISRAGTMATANGVIDFRNGLVSSRFSVVYQGYVEAYNEISKTMDICPATGHIAGIWSRISTNVGYWQVPAGVEANFRTTNKVSWSLTDNQQGVLNPLSINAVRFFSGYGLLVWGARTLSNNTDFRYISDSLTFNFVEQTILSSNLWAVFKPNNSALWSEIGINLDLFLTSQWRAGALRGDSKSEAFFVNFGKDVTSEYDILQGIVNIEVGLATQKPGEFVHYTISPKVNL